MQKATLLFLIEKERILLAMKKRGFGAGHWNGVGGKPEPNETIEEAAVRECQEEIGVTPISIQPVAKLDFYFPDKKSDWNQEVHVFLCFNWQGSPAESEEMIPKWFAKTDIPYEKMWADDKIWLPEVLAGKSVTAEFYFGNDEQITKHSIKASKI